MKTSILAVLAFSSSTCAFMQNATPKPVTTELYAESRREALGSIGLALGGLMFPQVSLAASNPALQTFKGSKGTKGAFIPGKGLRNNEDFEALMAANNPALETFKGRKGTKGAFIPGKGLRNNESFDSLLG